MSGKEYLPSRAVFEEHRMLLKHDAALKIQLLARKVAAKHSLKKKKESTRGKKRKRSSAAAAVEAAHAAIAAAEFVSSLVETLEK